MALADRYDLQQRLGAGAFGEVFRALERATGRTVAVKVLHRQDDDSRRRFHREAVVLHSQIGNEHVVGLLDHTGLGEDEPYLVLEYCALGSLRSWVGTGRSTTDVASALLHAARGLAGVHVAGGLHRDIKPENLLTAAAPGEPGWKIKLADFGLAGFPHPVTGTMTLNAFGTKGYIAPELFGGAQFHPGADVYSLGIVGVELLVGTVDVGALAVSHAPAGLKSLLQSMVNALPERRPTAQAVAEQLKALLAPPPVASPTFQWRPNHQTPVAAAPAQPQASSNVGENLAKGAVAFGIGALLFAGLKSFLGGRTYYDPNVDRNRAPNGQFRKG